MDLFAPFSGVLRLAGEPLWSSRSPITLADGSQVAEVQRHSWTLRGRFEVLDGAGRVAAEGGTVGFWGRRYELRTPQGSVLVGFTPGFWGPTSRSAITLAGGRVLTSRGNWSGGRFTVGDETRQVAVISREGGLLRPETYVVEVAVPVLSLLEAAGIAVCLRAAIRAQRSSSSSGSNSASHGGASAGGAI